MSSLLRLYFTQEIFLILLRTAVYACELRRGSRIAKFGVYKLKWRISPVYGRSCLLDCRWPNSNLARYILFITSNVICHVFCGFSFSVSFQIGRLPKGQVKRIVECPASNRPRYCFPRFLNLSRAGDVSLDYLLESCQMTRMYIAKLRKQI
jgi:hypothetical protein